MDLRTDELLEDRSKMGLDAVDLLAAAAPGLAGWGDTGLGVALGVAGFPPMMAQMTGKPELIERFSADDRIGC